MNYSQTLSSKTAAVLIAVSVVISIFIPATETIANTWYDSGWIYVGNPKYHADVVIDEDQHVHDAFSLRDFAEDQETPDVKALSGKGRDRPH